VDSGFSANYLAWLACVVARLKIGPFKGLRSSFTVHLSSTFFIFSKTPTRFNCTNSNPSRSLAIQSLIFSGYTLPRIHCLLFFDKFSKHHIQPLKTTNRSLHHGCHKIQHSFRPFCTLRQSDCHTSCLLACSCQVRSANSSPEIRSPY
jgi:hypothetical protein